MNEPIFDVAQLAHVELLTPNLEGTLNFFKDLLGVQETERRAQSVYLRAGRPWGELHMTKMKHVLGDSELLNRLLKINPGPFPSGGSRGAVRREQHPPLEISSDEHLRRKRAARRRSGD